MAMTTDRPNLERMQFQLEMQPDWPPVSVETLWVESVDVDRFRIDNIPFFVRDIAVGDVVTGEKLPGNILQFARKITSGGHWTVWVILIDHEVERSIRAEVEDIGCQIEGSPWPSLFSIDVPERKQLEKLQHRLNELESENMISYVIACIAA